MALFLGLYLGHILGDFVFQPGRLVLAKRRSQRAVLLHTAIVTICMALTTLGALFDLWPAVVVAGIAHFGVEQLTIRARRSTDTSGLAVFLIDQGMHIVSLALIAGASGTATPAVLGLWPISIGVLSAVCAVATVAFGGSILVFEVQLCGAPRSNGPDPVLGLDGSRIYGIAERAGALIAAFVLPAAALGALAFVPRVVYASIGPRESRANHLAAAGTGLVLCAVAWALVASANLGL